MQSTAPGIELVLFSRIILGGSICLDKSHSNNLHCMRPPRQLNQRASGAWPRNLLAVFMLFIAIVLTMAWRKGAKPAATRPMEVSISMCGKFVVLDDYYSSPVKLLNGLGELHYRITTRDSASQKFFNQGLRLIYGFNHVEALRAFEEASRR